MDFFEILLGYIIEDALIVIPVLLIFGYLLKHTPRVVDWQIPWILLFIGIIVVLLLIGFTVAAFIQGVLVAGAAVLAHQLYKQTKKRE